ncbi:MAG: ABC transporter permease subunit [Clostridiales bacterium]|jgi:NitT/TauT family transport system permease protein|nr:ABC transporter permease subunit [Clostridiales bacterium]
MIKRAFDSTAVKSIFNLTNLLFITVLWAAFMESNFKLQPPWAYVVILILFEAIFNFKIIKKSKPLKNLLDLYSIIFAFFLLWDLGSKQFHVLHYTLLPPPQNVFYIFTQDYSVMINGFFQSMCLILVGVVSGMLLGIITGLFVGWYPRLREAVTPVINVIASIPALVYAPYLVVVMPTFKIASVTIIFMGIYPPTTMNMISNVQGVDKKLIDTARSLNLNNRGILLKALLPACAIPLLGSLRIRIATAFMILIMAETIGATAGLGYYVKRWAAWADYPKVFAGVILIGVVVVGINGLIHLFETKAIKWIEPHQ